MRQGDKMVYVIIETYWDGERMNPEIKCVCKNRKSMEYEYDNIKHECEEIPGMKLIHEEEYEECTFENYQERSIYIEVMKFELKQG